jgi:hypothetical protein
MGYSQKFLDEHRDINTHHDWWDSVYDDFGCVCKILGIELDKDEPSFSGFWSQGDGASWSGRYCAVQITPWGAPIKARYDLAPALIREYAPKDEELHRIADELCLLSRVYYPSYIKVRRHDSRYAHAMTMCVSEIEPYDDAAEYADEVTDALEEALLVQFRALAEWLYAALEREHDYLTSDEAVADTLEANDIEEEQDDAA